MADRERVDVTSRLLAGPAPLLAAFLQGSRNQGLAGLEGAEQWRGAPACIPAVLLIQSKLTAPRPNNTTTALPAGLPILAVLFLVFLTC